MTCYHPLKGWWSKGLSNNGKRYVVFKPRDGYTDQPISVPCGQCIGCKLDRSRQWAIRCMHEAQMHDSNCFITLTYDDVHVPKDGSLRPKDFVDFMKRIRRKYGKGIKYYHAGEYGSLCKICGKAEALHKDVRTHRFVRELGRPHHHAILFGIDFEDKVRINRNHRGDFLYASADLFERWNGAGHCIIGNVSFDSAAYVARYITKKIFGERGIDHYGGRIPEYTTMSKGIGRSWFNKYGYTVKRDDDVVIEKHRVKPPRFYDKLMELDDPKHVAIAKAIRMQKAEEQAVSPKRLQQKENFKLIQSKKLKRDLNEI